MTGKAQSGKDSAAAFIIDKLAEKNKTVKCYSFAESLKDICHNIFGLSETQCWGSNKEKDTLTNFKWSDLPINKERLSVLMIRDKKYKSTEDFMTAREVMQVWGTDVFRFFDKDCWVRSVYNKIKYDNLDYAIITDARFENEINFFKNYDHVTIRFLRNVLGHSHESELGLDNYNFSGSNTYSINNQEISIEEKNKQLHEIIKRYI